VFPAKNHEAGEVSISIPPLQNVIAEGKYTGSLEVIIDDKVFVPMKIGTDFKKSINVVAEVVTHRTQETSLSVSPVITVNKRETVVTAEKDTVKNIQENSKNKKDEASKKVELKNNSQESQKDSIDILKQRIIEERIRKIAGKKNLKLSESKVKDIAKFLKNKDMRR
jgi:hypothetical protein